MPHFPLLAFTLLSVSFPSPNCPSRNVNVSFQLAEMVSLLCLCLSRGLRGDGGGAAQWEGAVRTGEIFYILGDSALLGGLQRV